MCLWQVTWEYYISLEPFVLYSLCAIFFESYKLYKLQIRVRTDLWLQILRGDSLFSIHRQNMKVSFAISLPSTW